MNICKIKFNIHNWKSKAHPSVSSTAKLSSDSTTATKNSTKGAFNWPYSGIRMRRLTSKYHVYENFDVIGIQRRFAASFLNKMLRNRPAFHSKEKSRDYSVYSYSRIGSIERALDVAMWSNTSDTFEVNYSIVRAVTAWMRQRAVDRLLGEPRYQSFSTTVKSFSLPGGGT